MIQLIILYLHSRRQLLLPGEGARSPSLCTRTGLRVPFFGSVATILSPRFWDS